MDKRTPGVLGLVFLAAFFLLLPAPGEAQVHIICAGAVTIAGNLSKVPSGGTLFVKGTCVENLTIAETRTNFTIDGQGSARLVAKDPTKAAVTFRGHRVTVKGLDISSGNVGIDVRQGGIATISANNIHNNGTGIRVRDVSNASIDSNSITTNGGDGIRVGTESGATISSNSITTNPGRGVRVEFASHAAIDNNIVSSNGSEGIEVADTSKATIGTSAGNDISSNGGSGVRVRRGSGVSIFSNTITGNTLGRGVRVESFSNAEIANNTITGNGTASDPPAAGVEVTQGSSAILGGTGACRPGEGDDSICVGGAGDTPGVGAGGSNAGNTGNTISGNGDDGVRVRRNSYASALSNIVSGNGLNPLPTTFPLDAGGNGFRVEHASSLDLQYNLIVGNNNSAVAVANNGVVTLSGTSQICPATGVTTHGHACTIGNIVDSSGADITDHTQPNETTGGYSGAGCLGGASCNGQAAFATGAAATSAGAGGAGLTCRSGGALSGIVTLGPAFSTVAVATNALAGNVVNAAGTALDATLANKDVKNTTTTDDCIDKTK